MNVCMRSTIVLIFAGALSAAHAQGRHDEKPHGTAKPAATQTQERAAPPVSGGRHDERPHGMTKAKPAANSEKTK